MKRKSKCVSRGQGTSYCDGCNTNSTKCPLRDKFRRLRNTKKRTAMYGPKTFSPENADDYS